MATSSGVPRRAARRGRRRGRRRALRGRRVGRGVVGFPVSSPSVKSIDFLNRSAVSRISLIGSSRTHFISAWKRAHLLQLGVRAPGAADGVGSFSGPRTTSASSKIKTISLPDRLNTRRSLWSCHHRRSCSSGSRRSSIRPIGFAHRGARAHARRTRSRPSSWAFLGATGLESDVWLTSDGVPVLDHDGIVRIGRRKRRVADLARADLPEHIPALTELYDRCGHDFQLSLDVKAPAAVRPSSP